MSEADKFQVFKYKIYVLAVRMKGIAIIYQIFLPTSDIIERFFSSAGYALPIDLNCNHFNP